MHKTNNVKLAYLKLIRVFSSPVLDPNLLRSLVGPRVLQIEVDP